MLLVPLDAAFNRETVTGLWVNEYSVSFFGKISMW